ncbi:MAG: DUF6569 family protein [Candidatus Sericytochromatia bacterium]
MKLQELFAELFARRPGLTIAGILRGCEAGPLQSAGVMQVIPLLSDYEDQNFVSPASALVSTAGYGNMVFENPGSRLLLVPCHAGYSISQAAQDHAMAHAGLVEAGLSRTFETAMCIQQSQGGYIAKSQYKLMILPYALREQALSKRGQKAYNKLWEDLSSFNQSFGLPAQGQLASFLRQFRQELDLFVAEFERLPRQLGAIVLVAGEVVGIERAPSATYFAGVWEALIRECYGSLAIAAGRGEALPETRVPLDLAGVSTLAGLEQALTQARQREDTLVRQAVRELLDQPFARDREAACAGYQLETLENAQFSGQALLHGESVVYASLFTSQRWRQERPRRQAAAFSI